MNFETKYNQIGANYNSTRFADEYLTSKIFKFLDSNPSELNLDIGCGTGNYTIALVERNLQFVGVEPSIKMLEIAESKSKFINWKIGSAEKIPAENEKFNNVIATLTIHHWSNIEKSLNEIYRVLKPGGKLIIFTSTPVQMENYWLNHYFPNMMKKSISQMPSLEEIESNLSKVKFKIIETENYFVTNELQDFFLYSGKERPHIYLDEKFRKGISSFASLSNKQEVENGLFRLKNDIESHKFDEIRNKYNSNNGDYFIIAKKDVA